MAEKDEDFMSRSIAIFSSVFDGISHSAAYGVKKVDYIKEF
jgi:hypothetical protein